MPTATPRPAGRLTGRALAPLVLAAMVAAGGAAAPAQALPAPRPAVLGGVNVIGLFSGATIATADREIANASKLHTKIVRAELRWSTLEPRGPGQIDPRALAFTDRLVADAAAAGIRVIFTVDSTPCWASSAPASLLRHCDPAVASAANAWPPQNPASYGAVTSYLAARYGTRLAAIEIWNEPDQTNQSYFAGPEKVQRYAALLRAAYVAVKQANPNVAVLGGSLVGANGLFLRALYAAGIKGYYDGLAVHFYTLVLASVRAIREVQLANGDSKPLWLDEFGWSSCYPQKRLQEEQACVTPQVQGQDLSDVMRSLSQAGYVAAAVVFKLQSSETEDFGVLTTKGARKPAFASLAGALAAPFGGVHRVTLALRHHSRHIVASGSGPPGDYMQLEAFVRGVLRYRALFTLDRFNRYAITLPAVLGTHRLRVRVFQFWGGPGRAAQRSL